MRIAPFNRIGRFEGSRTPAHEGVAKDRHEVRGRPVLWLLTGGFILVAGIAVGTAVAIDQFRERALKSAESDLEGSVLLLTRHFDQQLEDFQAVERDFVTEVLAKGIATADDFHRQIAGLDTHLVLKSKVTGSSAFAGINIFDSDGALINSSDTWPVPDISIADRAYFKRLQTDRAGPNVTLELVRSRLSQRWATVISRKVIGRDGKFLGVVSRAISPDYFERFLASIAHGAGAAVAMYDGDGFLLARYPHIEEVIGRNYQNGPAHRNVLAKSDYGTLRMRSTVDGLERVAAVRRLSAFPIAIVATRTFAAVLAEWWDQTQLLVVIAMLSALVTAAIVHLIVRQLMRQQKASQAKMAIEKERLDTALNNMTQGLLLFDSSQRLVICNQRYIDMYGVSSNIVKPGISLQEITAHRADTGSFQGDVVAHCAQVIQDMAERSPSIAKTADGRSIQIINQPMTNGGWVSTHEDITERYRAEERIARLAHYDSLTDLPNRVMFRERIAQELADREPGRDFAILYIDVDEFKGINDSLGHPIGDELLKQLAARLRDAVTERDMVARLGGDEFAILQSNLTDQNATVRLVDHIYQGMHEPFDCLGHRLLTDASIGIAIAPGDGEDLDTLLKNADLAMYAAKADGRRTYRFFEPWMDECVRARHLLEFDMREALPGARTVEGGFEVYYQPLVRLADGVITGCEALLRWRHPVRGFVSPAEFIPLAEDVGLISQLGEWVLNIACREAATWPGETKVAVNVSPIQFRSQTFALKVVAALAAAGLAPGRLELEITEAILIRDDEAALAILHELREIGVRIALDDFGTGYSSLSYLQRFPFDKIKIDRCFINEIDQPEASSSIVQAIVNIAASRGMTTTAEGVESEAQRKLLHGLGCTEMQGFHFSAAKPAMQVRALLVASDRSSTSLSAASANL